MTLRRLPLVVEQGVASTRLARAKLADSFSLRVGIENINCRKGCHHCCRYPVVISILEGISLYRALQRTGLWRSQLKADLEKHTSLTFGVAPEVWLMSDIACPLLVEGACSVYVDRPMQCRVTASTSDPDRCRSVYFGSDTFADNKPELAQFAAVEHREARSSRDHARGLDQRVPLSVAVLLGHLVVEGTIDFGEIPLTLLRFLHGTG